MKKCLKSHLIYLSIVAPLNEETKKFLVIRENWSPQGKTSCCRVGNKLNPYVAPSPELKPAPEHKRRFYGLCTSRWGHKSMGNNLVRNLQYRH